MNLIPQFTCLFLTWYQYLFVFYKTKWKFAILTEWSRWLTIHKIECLGVLQNKVEICHIDWMVTMVYYSQKRMLGGFTKQSVVSVPSPTIFQHTYKFRTKKQGYSIYSTCFYHTDCKNISILTFNESLEFIMADITLLQIDLECQQQCEEEFVILIQSTAWVFEHLIG